MSAKHTEGPWKGQQSNGRFHDTEWSADADGYQRTMFAPIVDAEGNTVALVVRTDWNDAQIEADARLIAAAPELLESLTALLEHYVELVNCGDCGKWNPENESEVLAARSAIAKATGTQS